MQILIVTQYFWPESFRINDLALGLLERGHQITVLTGVPNYPGGRFYKGYGFFNNEEDYHGVRVLRVPLIPRGSGGNLNLAINYVSFILTGCFLAPFLCRDNYDVILIFQMSPVTQALPALVLKKLYKCPVFHWVQDLWPESLSATGALRTSWVLTLVSRMVRFIYQRCDRVLIQAESFRGPVEVQGAAPNKIFYYPNSAEDLFTSPPLYEGDLPVLPEGFKIMFAGNIGAAQDFETIISAAERLKDTKEIQWIIVGDGRMRAWCEAEVKKRGLVDSFHFLGWYPLEAMPVFFSAADALLVTLRKEPIFALTIPSKIQSYLACGKPIVAGLDGEGASIIEKAGAGYTCSAGASDALATAVLKMYQTTAAERIAMGERGSSFYQKHFERNMLLDRLEGWMRELQG
jgi:glycosyltransferase involved in cell wall biosynthesis